MVGYAPPVRTGFETEDPEVAAEAVGQMYPGNRLSGARRGRVWFRVDSATAGPVRVDRARVGLAGRATSDPLDYLLLILPIAGGVGAAIPRTSGRFAAAQPLLCPVGTPVEFSWTRSFDQVVIPIPLEPVRQHAAAAFGIAPGQLRFTAMAPVSAAMSRHWQNTVNYVDREIHTDDSALGHPLVQNQIAQMLVTSVLATFPNTAMLADYTAGPRSVPAAALRRALAFIEAEADRPITVTEVAEAAAIGVRGLQKAFLQHVGVTPMAYARRVRLHRAHLELRAADPTQGATVKAIAARWGFADPDRFTALYRETFGVLPSRTLRD